MFQHYHIVHYQIVFVLPTLLSGIVFSLLALFFFHFYVKRFFRNRNTGIYFIRVMGGTAHRKVGVLFIDGTTPIGRLQDVYGGDSVVYISPFKTKLYILFFLFATLFVVVMMFVSLNPI